MLPRHHITIGLIISLSLFLTPLKDLEILLFFFSSWLLIDLDHYFRYIYIKNNFSIKNFLKFSKKEAEKWAFISKKQKTNYKKPIFIFHNIEFLFILFIVSLFFPIISFLILGFILHLFTDYTYAILKKEPILHKISLIATLATNKNKKRFI